MANPTVAQSILIIFAGTSMFVGLILGLPDIVAAWAPDYELWVREHMHQLIGGLVLALMAIGYFFSGRGMDKYADGDDPLAMARMMHAFDRKRMAIRYLESVPHHHPKAAEVQMQIRKLRQEV